MAVSNTPIYQEVYHFLISQPTKEEILAFRPSELTQQRIRALLAASKAGHLAPDDEAELNEFERVEHFVRMLKLYTQQLLDQS